MVDYIAAKNIDDRILERTVRALEEGKLAAFPTDTSWTIACSLNSKEGIRSMKRIAGERDERHFTLICAQIAQIGDYCSLDNTRFRLIKRLVPGPYVFVLKTLLGTEKALDIKRKELGVRIPDHPVPRAIVEALKSPLYSITAKRTMSEAGEPEFDGAEEEELFDGGWELEGVEGIDVILDTGEERPRLLSTVLNLSGDEISLIRAGAGEWPR